MRPFRHIPDLLKSMIEKPFQLEAYSYRKEGVWLHMPTKEVYEKIRHLALALKSIGVKKGDTVGIFSKSTPYWSIADYAIVLAGGITVPFFSNLSEEHFLFEVKDSEPKWMFVGDEDDLKVVFPHRNRFQGLIGLEIGKKEEITFSFDQLIESGSAILRQFPEAIQALEKAISPEDLATIIYSSGSTGNPKGVELTHKNLVCIIHNDEFCLRPTDKYLSILPLAHIFAKQIHLIMTAWGVPVYFLNDLKKIPDACREVPITRMITVPRVLEKAYVKMTETVKQSGFLKRTVGAWAFDLAHREEGFYKSMMQPIADKLVYSKIREAFGKNFHSILCGGAPLNPHLHRFYLSAGIPIIQGWGLTEGSTIAVNRLSNNKIGTVGPPIPGISFKISDEGEVLAKGPTIMRGYHKNPDATKKAIDPQGWLHTGDYGHFDEDGHLVIEGRMNESFKTSHGEFVSPTAIEQKFAECPLIDTAMVIGEGRPFPMVLLFPNGEALERLKKKEGIKYLNDSDFLNSSHISGETEQLIQSINAGLEPWQRLRGYRFILTPPTIEGGELTPTLKLRRKVILKKYQGIIEEMYKNLSH